MAEVIEADRRLCWAPGRFVVPAAGEAEFLAAVAATSTVFDGMDGCLQRHFLKQEATSDDTSMYITIVEWASPAAVQRAREATALRHKEMHLHPQELFQRLQIKAEMGHYVPFTGGKE